MSISVSVRIPDKLAKELNSIARATERSRSFIILKALEAYLADQADLQIALDRLRDATDPVISIDEMRNELEI